MRMLILLLYLIMFEGRHGQRCREIYVDASIGVRRTERSEMGHFKQRVGDTRVTGRSGLPYHIISREKEEEEEEG